MVLSIFREFFWNEWYDCIVMDPYRGLYKEGILQQMPLNKYIQSGGKYLRCGYTTGTCAALAAAAAARLLFTGHRPERVSLITPKGIRVEVEPDLCEYTAGEQSADISSMAAKSAEAMLLSAGPAEIHPTEILPAEILSARAAVRKDAGDDRDVTDGILIYATVTAERNISSADLTVLIDGGAGVGRVTKPGLDQPVGSAAINTVPRAMITEAVTDICESVGFFGIVKVVISVPDGEAIAGKTFNAHLGIEGGISILGTSGIVEPMSMQAFIDAVCVEIRQVRLMNDSGRLILTPGNYGMDFLKRVSSAREGIGITGVPVVVCSNFIGDALDAAAAEGFHEVLLVGHIGKLVKLAGGIMNTHSRYADCRTELFAAHAAICGAGTEICRQLMDCVTTDACLDVLREAGFLDTVMHALCESMDRYLGRRAGGAIKAGAVTFSNVHGLLGCTPTAERMIEGWTAEAFRP